MDFDELAERSTVAGWLYTLGEELATQNTIASVRTMQDSDCVRAFFRLPASERAVCVEVTPGRVKATGTKVEYDIPTELAATNGDAEQGRALEFAIKQAEDNRRYESHKAFVVPYKGGHRENLKQALKDALDTLAFESER